MTTEPTLTADHLLEILRDCLFTPCELVDGAAPPDACTVQGILTTYQFHRARLESHRAEIHAMLEELPDTFQAGKGGGWSFLNACVRQDGEQWGEHHHMELLFCLAIGLDLAQWLMPRDFWGALPGGMPYVQVKL